MTFTPGTPSGPYTVTFIRYVDETYPTSPLWVDGMEIVINYCPSDSNSEPFEDGQIQFQNEIDNLAEILAPSGWVFSGAHGVTSDGSFALTPEE